MSHENINTGQEKLNKEDAEDLAREWEVKASEVSSSVKRGLFQTARKHEELKLQAHRNSVKAQSATHDWNEAMRDPSWGEEDDIWEPGSGWR